MDDDKSVLEKISDTLKDAARTVTGAASEAVKTDRLALRADERAVAYMPLAAEGLVSDPLLTAPVIRKRARRRTATERAARAKKSVKKAAKRSTRKAAQKSSARKAAPRKSKKTEKSTKRARKSATRKTRR